MNLKNQIALFFLLVSTIGSAQDNQITLVSWNIEGFGSRTPQQLEKIAEVVKMADIIAIQEVPVKKGSQQLALLQDILDRKGHKWDVQISDPTNTSRGRKEKYAFLWKTSRVRTKTPGQLVKALDSKIEREPYSLRFYSGEKTFILINIHVRYEPKKAVENEIKALAKYLLKSKEGPFIVMGDFNHSLENKAFQRITKKRFTIALKNQKTTILEDCEDGNYMSKPLDNFVYSNEILFHSAGIKDYIKRCDFVVGANQISDHLPVYFKFSL